MDHDGFDDVVVLSRPAISKPPEITPTAYLYRGSRSGLLLEAGWQVTAHHLGATDLLLTGRAGDVNGDGYSDFYFLAVNETPAGPVYRVLLFQGTATGPKPDPDTQWEEPDTPINTGLRLACAGDVNGDGYDDLVIGVPMWSGISKARGRILVYHGSPQGLKTTSAWTATYDLPAKKDVDENYEQHFGWSVASAGDVNDDGFADVIVGAPFADQGDLNEGLAFVYYGSSAGLSRKPQWIIESNHPYALLGYCVGGAGDVNGDGIDDVIVGVPQATDGQFNEGAALVFHGSKSGLHPSPDWSVESDNSNQCLGKGVTAAGDVNGDGYDDVLVSAPDYQRDGKTVERVYLCYGSPQGLPNTFNYRINKPWLLAVQQRMDRISELRKLAVVGVLFGLSALLFIAWRRTAARMRSVEQENVRTLERERLARDVHDHLGADLSQIALWSELSKGNANGSEEINNSLGRIAQTARSALGSINELVWRLDPRNDKLENFTAHLEYLAQQALLQSGLQLSLDIPDDLPDATLNSNARTNLAFMVKEAIRNIVQHAAATRVTLQLRAGPSHTLCARLTDNGNGFAMSPPNGARPHRTVPGGNGLRNLQVRAAQLGGEAKIESTLGQGTTVTITVPLNRPS